jgi:hypothetical protein
MRGDAPFAGNPLDIGPGGVSFVRVGDTPTAAPENQNKPTRLAGSRLAVLALAELGSRILGIPQRSRYWRIFDQRVVFPEFRKKLL